VENPPLYITDEDSNQESKKHGEKVRHENSQREKARAQ
jgi:hypothetical protein